MNHINKVFIYGVKKDSIADEIGLQKGDYIITINGEEIIDILDYKFHIDDEYVELEVEHANGEVEIFEIEKDVSEDLGIEFEHELIDKPKNCTNKCIFCFMEQLPENVRDTLIFKDDDYRLSFFTGNYITLTNMKESDIDRIIRYRLSPINISIHATDETVRCMMLNNRFAGKVLSYLDKLYQAGISMNTQIVLCKGINDGQILEKTIQDLAKYTPVLKSICIVPVGLSKNREGLYDLKKIEKEDCINTIDMVSSYQEGFKKKFKSPIIYLADEFYLKANKKIPNYSDYLDFGEIEDGIGMISLFDHDFNRKLKKVKEEVSLGIINKDMTKTVTLITGKIVDKYIRLKAKRISRLFNNITIKVVSVENEYFGTDITVTGLVVGRDIISTLSKLMQDGVFLGDYVILPEVMLKDDEDIFLDDTTLQQVQEGIDTNIVVSDGTADGFVDAIIQEFPNKKIIKFNKKSNRQSYENSINH
ncbi:MAG: DUF512 domain-containing protein [Clostridia bacterium]|nr:DUF512 domain-containing protein [Clostridia bacterium]